MTKEVLIFLLLIVFYMADAMQFQGNQIVRPFVVHRRVLSAPANSQQADAIEDMSKFKGLEEKENNQPKQTLPENFLNAEDDHANSKYWPVENFEHPATESAEKGFDWQPIFDAKVLEFLGEFFSEEIKDEANRERKEREKLHEKELYEKYNGMLNDPGKLKLLQEEAKNSPKYINQVVRRSFGPSWQPQGRSSNQYIL